VQVADLLSVEGIQIIFSGDQSEVELVSSIQDQLSSPSINLAGTGLSRRVSCPVKDRAAADFE
jgi:hypothetical protein